MSVFQNWRKKLKISEQTQIIWVSSSPCLCAINVGRSSCWVHENLTFHLNKIELKGSTVTECGAQRSPPFAHLESSLAPRGNVCTFLRSVSLISLQLVTWHWQLSYLNCSTEVKMPCQQLISIFVLISVCVLWSRNHFIKTFTRMLLWRRICIQHTLD